MAAISNHQQLIKRPVVLIVRLFIHVYATLETPAINFVFGPWVHKKVVHLCPIFLGLYRPTGYRKATKQTGDRDIELKTHKVLAQRMTITLGDYIVEGQEYVASCLQRIGSIMISEGKATNNMPATLKIVNGDLKHHIKHIKCGLKQNLKGHNYLGPTFKCETVVYYFRDWPSSKYRFLV